MNAELGAATGSASGEALIEARGLAWEAGGRQVLHGLDFQIRRGEHLVLVGPNGAGKTTLLRLLTGLLTPSAGELRFAGELYSRIPSRQLARRVAYVPQIRPARVPFTVEELVLQGRYPHLSAWQLGPAATDFAAVQQALVRAGVEDLRHRRLDELSGGERQSAYIAAALAQEAQVLVLDEPTTHLDPRHQRDVAGLLLRLGRDPRQTVITATHELTFASRLADRVIALREGRILAMGGPGEIFVPEVLQELFDAPFEVLLAGDRPLTLLRFDSVP